MVAVRALEVVKRLWTEERVTFHGKHFHLEDVGLTMRPLQTPRPPIVVAASNDRMVERVARIADAWTIAGHATLATLERQVGLYRAALQAEGKPFPPPCFSLGKELYIAGDMDTALREALPYLATKYEAYAQWGQDHVLPAGETFRLPIEELRQDRFIVGDPQYCIEQIAEHEKRLGHDRGRRHRHRHRHRRRRVAARSATTSPPPPVAGAIAVATPDRGAGEPRQPRGRGAGTRRGCPRA